MRCWFSAVAQRVFGGMAGSVVVDCAARFTAALLFDALLRGLLAPTTTTTPLPKCDSAADFAAALRLHVGGAGPPRFLVLDNAHALRRLGLVSGLLRLQETNPTYSPQANAHITVVFISALPWHKFKEAAEANPDPIFLYFPAYTAKETRSILALDCPPEDTLDPSLFLQFVDLAQNILSTPCRDLSEFKHIVALLYPKYKEPVVQGKVKKEDAIKLYRHIEFYFKEVLDKLYTRKLSSTEWAQTAATLRPTLASQSQSLNEAIAIDEFDMDLPYNTIYLLLASFIASYNPKGLDVRFFAKASEKRTRKVLKVSKYTSAK
ncbi:Origin recognition complex subunit 5, partial [Physocladia obscura]